MGTLQAEAKTKNIRKGFTYEYDKDEHIERVYMDISKIAPEEGETALNRLSVGKYGDKPLYVKVKAKSAAQAKKKYISWGRKFQGLAANKYRLLPFSSDASVDEMWNKKGYYECVDNGFSVLYTYYYMNRYIDNIFNFSDPQEKLNGTERSCSPIEYSENFVFQYTDLLGKGHTEKINPAFIDLEFKSVYSDIISKKQFAEASDAVKVALLLFPRRHYCKYAVGRPMSDWDMKALAEKRWIGKCGNSSMLGFWLTTHVSFDVKYLPVILRTVNHAVGFACAKNSDGKWEYFRVDNMDTTFNMESGIRYNELERLSEEDSLLKAALTYMKSGSVPELTAMTLEYNIKKGLKEGRLDAAMEETLDSLESEWFFSHKYEPIDYAFVNQNENTYGYPEITGTFIIGEY